MALKRKHEGDFEQQSFYGDGLKWFRGPIIKKGRFGSVYLATLKKPKWRLTHHPPLMAVKSAEVSGSTLLQKELMVLYNLKADSCPYIRRCFGDETTTSESNQMIFNLLLEHSFAATLADMIKKSGGKGLLESNVRRYTRYILQGLEWVHKREYVHCDLKPESIIVFPIITSTGGREDRVKIGDFGLAKRVKKSETREKILDPFYYRGSVRYLSPEVVVEKVQGPASDIWALGCVVVEMLTGKSIWDGKKDWEVKDFLHEALPKLPYESEVSKEGRNFLKGCFARKPERRWTAEMLLNHPFLARLDNNDDIENQESVVEDSELEEKIRSPSSPSSFNDEAVTSDNSEVGSNSDCFKYNYHRSFVPLEVLKPMMVN